MIRIATFSKTAKVINLFTKDVSKKIGFVKTTKDILPKTPKKQ